MLRGDNVGHRGFVAELFRNASHSLHSSLFYLTIIAIILSLSIALHSY